MTTPTVPPDDRQRRQHAFLDGSGAPILIGGEGKMLSRAQAIEHLRALRNTGRLAADQVTLIDYTLDEGGDEVVRNLGPVSTRFPASGGREIARSIARIAGFGGPGDDEPPEPPEAA